MTKGKWSEKVRTVEENEDEHQCGCVVGGRGGCWVGFGGREKNLVEELILIGFGILFTTLGIGVLEKGDNCEVQLWQVV